MPRLSSPSLRIARIDHWPKNAVVPLGGLVAVLVNPAAAGVAAVPPLVLAFLGACLVASSNYTLNELLDAVGDREHPVKRSRAVASGQVSPARALGQWVALGAAGLLLGAAAHVHVALALAAFWAAAVLYNVPPLRTKDVPHLDVLTEALNNQLRLHLYRDPGFLEFAAASLAIFVVLMFVHVPDLYELFNVEPARSVPLWTVGGPAAGERP